mmetsp:Transcript_52897/g.92915  ORF Transcript_52897/g.92915 Transcript_52897/m.92915 type:complete len:104 (-) Transcript_52897:468-779(-)
MQVPPFSTFRALPWEEVDVDVEANPGPPYPLPCAVTLLELRGWAVPVLAVFKGCISETVTMVAGPGLLVPRTTLGILRARTTPDLALLAKDSDSVVNSSPNDP